MLRIVADFSKARTKRMVSMARGGTLRVSLQTIRARDTL